MTQSKVIMFTQLKNPQIWKTSFTNYKVQILHKFDLFRYTRCSNLYLKNLKLLKDMLLNSHMKIQSGISIKVVNLMKNRKQYLQTQPKTWCYKLLAHSLHKLDWHILNQQGGELMSIMYLKDCHSNFWLLLSILHFLLSNNRFLVKGFF